MNSSDKQREVDHERAMEQRYRDHLDKKASRPLQPDGPASWRFTKTVVRQPKPSPYVELVGRIALVEPDDELGGFGFYLGYRHAQIDGVEVFNWRGKFGRSFFHPTSVDPETENVAAIRTFHHSDNVIDDFVDDIVCDRPPEPVFGRAQPAARPRASELPTAHVADQSPEASVRPVGHTDREKSEKSVTQPRSAQAGHTGRSNDTSDIQPFVRAERLLSARLRAPRTPSLTPVLSTLQPEQYRLITAPATHSMVVEGGPGSGKSIIASHRAAYFISDDPHTPSTCEGDILVVGPTSRYSEHVRGVISELTGDSPHVRVITLQELGQPVEAAGGTGPHRIPEWIGHKAKASLRDMVRAARTHLKLLEIAGGLEVTYLHLRSNGSGRRRLTTEPAWQAFFDKLPRRYEQARLSPSLVWLLALIEHYARPDGARSRVGHIIVDEAQDVAPGEWLKLWAMNDANAWTILGDLNQRRTDNTFTTWSDISNAAGLPSTTTPIRLDRGYRSTEKILEFANRLLPPDNRPPPALRRDGSLPEIVRTVRELLPATVVQQVERLQATYPQGTVAVITNTPGIITPLLRSDPARAAISVLTTNEARGLEFDAVVVVEPTDLPRNDRRRRGPLYTALTRPNHELVIVHTKDLPHELQPDPSAFVER